MTAAAFERVADTPSPSKRRAWARSEEARGLAMISPTFLYALALLFLPVLIVIAYSFWTQNYLDIDRTFTLENYRQALTEPIYRDLFIRSLWISLTVSIVTVAFSYPVAWFISFHGGMHKNLWLFLVTVPCWTSYLLRVMSWKVILGYGGVLNTGLISTEVAPFGGIKESGTGREGSRHGIDDYVEMKYLCMAGISPA